jgi:hypothetical protein
VNIGSRAPAWPLFYMALREGGPTATNGKRPRSGRVSDRADPEIRSRSGDPVWGDHIPNSSQSSSAIFSMPAGHSGSTDRSKDYFSVSTNLLGTAF